MKEKIDRNVPIPAILLILPVMSVLIFDPAAWLSKTNLISDILGTVFFIDIPVGMCLWHWFKPEHFKGKRSLLIFGGLTFFSWGAVAAGMWLSCKTGHMPENGFSIFCACALGWAYIWMFMVPIGIVYVFFRAVLKLVQYFRRNDHAE